MPAKIVIYINKNVYISQKYLVFRKKLRLYDVNGLVIECAYQLFSSDFRFFRRLRIWPRATAVNSMAPA